MVEGELNCGGDEVEHTKFFLDMREVLFYRMTGNLDALGSLGSQGETGENEPKQ